MMNNTVWPSESDWNQHTLRSREVGALSLPGKDWRILILGKVISKIKAPAFVQWDGTYNDFQPSSKGETASDLLRGYTYLGIRDK